MAGYRITNGPTLEELVRSLTGLTPTRSYVVAFTIPVGSGGDGGWIWDGSCDKVSVQISLLERIDAGKDPRSEDWRFAGKIWSVYKGLDESPVKGTYSVATRTGALTRDT